MNHIIVVDKIGRRLSNENSNGIQCCQEDGSGPINRLVQHPECFPIEIPSNDPFFSKHGQRCMNFVRSMPAPQLSCTFGYGEQMNQITHFLDGSNVYGSDEEDAKQLRTQRGGLLRTLELFNFDIVPSFRAYNALKTSLKLLSICLKVQKNFKTRHLNKLFVYV